MDMNHFLRTFAVLALISTGLFSVNTLAAQVAGKIQLVKGNVFILNAQTKAIVADPAGKKGRSTKKGSPFFEGEIIQTKPSARVKLEFIEGKNTVVLGPGTSLVIQRAGDNAGKKGTDLELKKGSVRSVVKKKYSAKGSDVFQVKTPNAVAGVRGTVFNVSFDIKTAKTNVLTESGLVSLMSRKQMDNPSTARFGKSSKEVLVKAGTKSEMDSKSAQPTPAKKASKKEINQLKKMDDVNSEENPQDASPATVKKNNKKEQENNVDVAMAPQPSDTMKSDDPASSESGDRAPASASGDAGSDQAGTGPGLPPPPKEENFMMAGGAESVEPSLATRPTGESPFDIVSDARDRGQNLADELTSQRQTDGVRSEIGFKIE